MRIYRYWTNPSNYKSLRIVKEELVMFHYELDGRRVAQQWTPIEVEFEKRKKMPDCFDIGGQPVLNQRALQVFQPLLGEQVEVLPLEVKGSHEKLFLLNALDILDCLNHDRTVHKIGKDGTPLWITTYRFKSGCIGDRFMFRLPETWMAETLITESFTKVVIENHLRGLVINQSTLLDDAK